MERFFLKFWFSYFADHGICGITVWAHIFSRKLPPTLDNLIVEGGEGAATPNFRRNYHPFPFVNNHLQIKDFFVFHQPPFIRILLINQNPPRKSTKKHTNFDINNIFTNKK